MLLSTGYAEVVELVDALASGASGRKLVGVRVPPSALQVVLCTAKAPSPRGLLHLTRVRVRPLRRGNIVWQVRDAVHTAERVGGARTVCG